MSRLIKELLRKELRKRFEGVTSLAVVGFTGLDAVTTNRLRNRLLEKDIALTVVKNSLAKQVFKELDLAQAAGLLEGPCAIALGVDPEKVGVVTVVRELLLAGKDAPSLTVKAALLEGEVFGPEKIEELSRFPTRDEAIGGIVTCALSPARKLAGCLIGPGAAIAGAIKQVGQKQDSPDGAAEAA